MSIVSLEHEVLVHRYLYYVRTTPIISEYEYDLLEKRAQAEPPGSSPVHLPGSDRVADYSIDVIVSAINRLI